MRRDVTERHSLRDPLRERGEPGWNSKEADPISAVLWVWYHVNILLWFIVRVIIPNRSPFLTHQPVMRPKTAQTWLHPHGSSCMCESNWRRGRVAVGFRRLNPHDKPQKMNRSLVLEGKTYFCRKSAYQFRYQTWHTGNPQVWKENHRKIVDSLLPGLITMGQSGERAWTCTQSNAKQEETHVNTENLKKNIY
jgi:hypothetical protein